MRGVLAVAELLGLVVGGTAVGLLLGRRLARARGWRRPRGGGAKEVGQRALAHAGPLTTRHGQNLLSELPVVVGGVALRIVLEHARAANRRLGELDRLADPRLEDQLAEVLLEDLHRLLGVDGPRVEHGRQDALDLHSRVEVLTDHLERVLKLDQPPHGEILALYGDDHLVGRGQGVDGQQPEAGRRIDADEVVVVDHGRKRLLERALAADLRAHRDLGPGEVDRGDRDVDLALGDHLANRDVVDEHVVHARLDLVGIDALAHGQVPLRVEVDAEDAMAGLGERDREVERGRRLGDAALLVREGDDLRTALGLVADLAPGSLSPGWRDGESASLGADPSLVLGRRRDCGPRGRPPARLGAASRRVGGCRRLVGGSATARRRGLGLAAGSSAASASAAGSSASRLRRARGARPQRGLARSAAAGSAGSTAGPPSGPAGCRRRRRERRARRRLGARGDAVAVRLGELGGPVWL